MRIRIHNTGYGTRLHSCSPVPGTVKQSDNGVGISLSVFSIHISMVCCGHKPPWYRYTANVPVMCYFQSRLGNGSSASGRTVKAQVSEPLPQVNSPPASVPTPAVSETASILSTDVSPSFVPTAAVSETASIPSTNLSPPSSSFAHSPPPGIPTHSAEVSPPVKRPYCEDDNDILVRYPCVHFYGIYIYICC